MLPASISLSPFCPCLRMLTPTHAELVLHCMSTRCSNRPFDAPPKCLSPYYVFVIGTRSMALQASSHGLGSKTYALNIRMVAQRASSCTTMRWSRRPWLMRTEIVRRHEATLHCPSLFVSGTTQACCKVCRSALICHHAWT